MAKIERSDQGPLPRRGLAWSIVFSVGSAWSEDRGAGSGYRLRLVVRRAGRGGRAALAARPGDGRHAAARHAVRRRAAAVWSAASAAVAVTIFGYVACRLSLHRAARRARPRRRRRTSSASLAYLFTCALIIGFGEAMRPRERASRASRRVAARHAAQHRRRRHHHRHRRAASPTSTRWPSR